MTLLENGKIIDDEWAFVSPSGPLPTGGHVVVDVERLQREHSDVLALNGPLALFIENDQDLSVVADDIHRFDMIVLNFPVYTDGRAYSQARQLRWNYDFKGKIRARGDILCDQFSLLARSGFDVLEVQPQVTPEIYDQAVTEISGAYQV